MKKYYICKHCGNIIEYIENSGVKVMCCGEEMQELVPNTVDASSEKHIPVITKNGNELIVNVGSVDHPMVEEHFIKWISIVTNKGSKINYLKPNEMPKTSFMLDNDEELKEVYSFCNIHGLWKIEN